MRAFAVHFSFEFRTGIRNRNLLLLNYLFPLGFYLLMGLVMTQINPTFAETMTPAMVVFALLAATMLGLPDPLVTARESGILRSYKINGVPALSILVIPALTTMLHTLVVAAIITGTATTLFGAAAPVNWAGFLLTFFSTALACAGVGVLIGVVSSSTRMTVLWSQLVFLPSMLLGGMMVPYSMLPAGVGRIAQLLPTTQAMNAFRGLALGLTADFAPVRSVGVLLGTGLLGFALALYLFNWDRRNASQRGNTLMGLLVLLPAVIGMLAS